MQIRYQNVRKNITCMSMSLAFMTKVLVSAHLSFSSYHTIMNYKILKSSKKWCQRMTCFKCLPSFIREWHLWKSWQKLVYFGVLIVFILPWLPQMSFSYETWQALKTFIILWHQFFWIFLNFLRFYCSSWCDKS